MVVSSLSFYNIFLLTMEVGIAKFEKVVSPFLLPKQFCCAQHNWYDT